MSNLVKGKNAVVSMFIIDAWYPIFCAKSATFERVQDEIEVTSINSGADKEFIPGMRSATLSMTGVTTLNNTNGRISVLYLDQQSRSVHQLRISLTDNSANNVAITFNAIITRNGFSRDVSSYSQSFVDFRVTGAITYGSIIAAPVEPDIFSDYWDTTAGTRFVTGSSESVGKAYDLTGITLIAVYREGIEYDIVTGSPGNRECRYVSGTPSVEFQDNFNTGERVFIVFTE